MTLQEIQRMAQLERALDIAAEMFAKEGDCAPSGNPEPRAIKRFLLRKAREEMRSALSVSEADSSPRGGAKKKPSAL